MADEVMPPMYSNMLPSDLPNRRHLLFVYGTLKRDGGNATVHKNYMGDCVFIGKCSIEGVMMYLGFYPGLVHDEVCRVTGEVWEVTASSIWRMDGYEGVPNNFVRRLIKTPFGTAWCYYKNWKGQMGDATSCVDRGYWTGSHTDRMPYHKVVDFFKNRRYNEPEQRNREPKIIVYDVIPESSQEATPTPVLQLPAPPVVKIKPIQVGPGLGVM